MQPGLLATTRAAVTGDSRAGQGPALPPRVATGTRGVYVPESVRHEQRRNTFLALRRDPQPSASCVSLTATGRHSPPRGQSLTPNSTTAGSKWEQFDKPGTSLVTEKFLPVSARTGPLGEQAA